MTISLTAQQQMTLMGMEARSNRITMEDRYTEFKKLGLPSELTTAFTEMSVKTAKTVVGKSIEVGKIIIDQIILFIKENPNMAVGAAIGAAVGALGFLIPFIGPVVGPVTTAIGAGVGAIAGHHIDKSNKGEQVSEGVRGVAEDLITIAKAFFKLLADIFTAIIDTKSVS